MDSFMLKRISSKTFAIYHTSLIALITAMSGAYLANGMTIVWIFVEATTLAVAALIYHDRTAVALEATWKYIFVCSVGIALAYIGILFLGFTVKRCTLASPFLCFRSRDCPFGRSLISQDCVCLCPCGI